MRVLGQEIEQKLGLYLGQPSAPVGGDALLEFRAREDACAFRVLGLAESLQLPHQAVELGIVECAYCLFEEETKGARARGMGRGAGIGLLAVLVGFRSEYRPAEWAGKSGLTYRSLMTLPQQYCVVGSWAVTISSRVSLCCT